MLIEVKESSDPSSWDLSMLAEEIFELWEFYLFKDSIVSYFTSGMLKNIDFYSRLKCYEDRFSLKESFFK